MAGVFDIKRHDTIPPAPGELELVQRFMNLHEHAPGVPGDLPPSRELVRSFLVDRRLVHESDPFREGDYRRALELLEALHARVRANHAEPAGPEHIAVIDRTAGEARLEPRFTADGPPRLEPRAGGARGALGRLVSVAFLSELGGSWGELKECAHENCRGVFYDRSKNHSGRWCSMRSCGNRNKVRTWRARHGADDLGT